MGQNIVKTDGTSFIMEQCNPLYEHYNNVVTKYPNNIFYGNPNNIFVESIQEDENKGDYYGYLGDVEHQVLFSQIYKYRTFVNNNIDIVFLVKNILFCAKKEYINIENSLLMALDKIQYYKITELSNSTKMTIILGIESLKIFNGTLEKILQLATIIYLISADPKQRANALKKIGKNINFFVNYMREKIYSYCDINNIIIELFTLIKKMQKNIDETTSAIIKIKNLISRKMIDDIFVIDNKELPNINNNRSHVVYSKTNAMNFSFKHHLKYDGQLESTLDVAGCCSDSYVNYPYSFMGNSNATLVNLNCNCIDPKLDRDEWAMRHLLKYPMNAVKTPKKLTKRTNFPYSFSIKSQYN